jgi:predicted ArsR family transcriptional regulator
MQPRFTVAEIAERLKVDREIARGLVRFLSEIEIALIKGERKPENGRGRSETVYAFEEDFENTLVDVLKEAKLT